MLKCTYIVERIDGDYAMLRREDETDQNAEPKMTARALLPPEIMEGTRRPSPLKRCCVPEQ